MSRYCDYSVPAGGCLQLLFTFGFGLKSCGFDFYNIWVVYPKLNWIVSLHIVFLTELQTMCHNSVADGDSSSLSSHIGTSSQLLGIWKWLFICFTAFRQFEL